MIALWQWAAIAFLIIMLAGFSIYTSPHSYAYLHLSGACNAAPEPRACLPFGRGFSTR